MKARILDKTALESISPASLRAYVVYEGWEKTGPFGKYAEVYVRKANGSVDELLLPFTTEIADYASSVGEAIEFLSRFEQRDEIAIYADLSRAARDVIRVRASDGGDDGSIEVDGGVEIVQHARTILASAACAAIEPRRAYHLGKVQQAEEYMRRVRLGQTEHGSFVVTLLAPIPPTLSGLDQPTLWPDMEEEPFERRVTRTLAEALSAAHDAVLATNRGDGLTAFTNVVTKGVSANLCEALASIIDRTGEADVSVTWARTRPTPRPRYRAIFGKNESETLREAARQFRLREPRRDERIFGYVRKLNRPEDQFDGRVTIGAIVDGRARSLSVRLAKEDYDIAIRAHREQLPITVLGDLEPERQRWTLLEPRELRIIEDEDEPQIGVAVPNNS